MKKRSCERTTKQRVSPLGSCLRRCDMDHREQFALVLYKLSSRSCVYNTSVSHFNRHYYSSATSAIAVDCRTSMIGDGTIVCAGRVVSSITRRLSAPSSVSPSSESLGAKRKKAVSSHGTRIQVSKPASRSKPTHTERAYHLAR